MKNDAQLGTMQITGPCIINKEVHQHNQGQDDKAEGREGSIPLSFSFSAYTKKMKSTTVHCKTGMNRPLGNTMDLNPMMEVVQNLYC